MQRDADFVLRISIIVLIFISRYQNNFPIHV